MLKNKKIDIRIRGLRFNLDQLNSAYNEMLRDTVIDSGLEYGKEYPFDSVTIDILKKKHELEKLREDMLFFYIFNFTQVYYSIKEYFKKEYEVKKNKVEDFYSTRQLEFKARKDISNDLKHNPTNNLRYETRLVNKEETIEDRKRIFRANIKWTWFYYDNDSVEYCNKLYKELLEFISLEFLHSPLTN